MGWSSGGPLLDVIESVILKYVPRDKWLAVATPIWCAFENADYDEGVDEDDISLWGWVYANSENFFDVSASEMQSRNRWYEKLEKKFGPKA